jgi:glycosyltransferase involved in cell wall biosynthesis
MSPDRILVFARSTVDHPIAGGMERSFESVFEQIRMTATVGLVTTHGAETDLLASRYPKVWTVAGGRPGRYSLFWWWATASKKAKWWNWDPSVTVSISAAGGLAASRMRTIPSIAQCHGTSWAELKSSVRTRTAFELLKLPLNVTRVAREILTYRRFDRIASISDTVTAQLIGWPYLLNPNRIVEIPNGIDEALFQFSAERRQVMRRELDLPDNASVGLSVGRLHVQKGVDIAIRALNKAPENRHLLVCGDGPDKERLETLVSELKLADRVHFMGKIQQGQIAELMSASDVFVFPTRRNEGLPLNVLEALACGLHVLTTTHSSLPHDIVGRVVILKADPADFSRAWSRVDPAPLAERPSALPSRYTTTTVALMYRKLISELRANSRKRHLSRGGAGRRFVRKT